MSINPLCPLQIGVDRQTRLPVKVNPEFIFKTCFQFLISFILPFRNSGQLLLDELCKAEENIVIVNEMWLLLNWLVFFI